MNRFKMVSSCFSLSPPLLKKSTKLSKLEAEWTFMRLQSFWMGEFVRYGFCCSDSSLTLPTCWLAGDSAWLVRSWSDDKLFLAK